MSRKRGSQAQGFIQSIQKFLLSGFVILTFAAYLIHERLTNPANVSPTSAPTNTGLIPTVADPNASSPTTTNPIASILPSPTAVVTGGVYKNGTYTGPSVNVFYGLVQVQVVVQNGQIANVQFLDYPHDRRTSQEINSQVMPWLTQEAIQAQSANVNLISGATLTSEGFVSSLQSALLTATN